MLASTARLLCALLLLHLFDILSFERNYKFVCYKTREEAYSFTMHETQTIDTYCKSAVSISQIPPSTPVQIRSFSQDQVDALLSIKHVDMCLVIEESSFKSLNLLMENLTGSCAGPILKIYGNHLLENITTGPFVDTIDPYRVHIHGNRKLDASQLAPFKGFPDVQEDKECLTNAALTYYPESLNNCTHVYGQLYVYSNMNVSGWKKFKYTGCLRIQRSLITHLKFLDYVKEFKPINGCSQFISENANLCVEDPSAITAKFPGVYIYNNKADCAHQCNGGMVNEEYLNNTSDCETRIGDLIITNWTGKPKNIDVLLKTKFIQGRLVITYNKGLGSFNHLRNVEEIGTPEIWGEGPAMNVLNNTDLVTLDMPKLKRVAQFRNNIRVRIRNNDDLELSNEEVSNFEKAAGGGDHADLEFQLRDTEKGKLELTILTYLLPLILLLALLLMLLLFIRNKTRSTSSLPRPPFRLSKKSQTILLDMSKEIVANNPMVWRVLDRPLIWRYPEKDPARDEVAGLKNKHTNFLKNHKANILKNAAIPRKDRKLIMSRIESLLQYPVAVMISTSNSIADVIPSMPNEIGTFHSYERNDTTITFRLLRLAYIGERTLGYVYEVVVVKGQDRKETKKLWRVVLYVWDQVRLPIELSELLQVLKLFSDKKSVFVSNRRKEIFALLHLIYTYVIVLQQAIGVEEAFRLHTDNCNGAPLDSHEMLCVMAFILEWAHQSYSIPKSLVQKHAQWCHTYARMSAFSKAHPSVMTIRPEHLVTSRQADLIEELDNAGPSAGAKLSERPLTPMKDKVRIRTTAERIEHTKMKPTPVAKQVDDFEDDNSQKTDSFMLGTKKYRAALDDPARKAEEQRIAQALRKRETQEAIPSTQKGSLSEQKNTRKKFSPNECPTQKP